MDNLNKEQEIVSMCWVDNTKQDQVNSLKLNDGSKNRKNPSVLELQLGLNQSRNRTFRLIQTKFQFKNKDVPTLFFPILLNLFNQTT